MGIIINNLQSSIHSIWYSLTLFFRICSFLHHFRSFSLWVPSGLGALSALQYINIITLEITRKNHSVRQSVTISSIRIQSKAVHWSIAYLWLFGQLNWKLWHYYLVNMQRKCLRSSKVRSALFAAAIRAKGSDETDWKIGLNQWINEGD